jgi:hypothetical protein
MAEQPSLTKSSDHRGDDQGGAHDGDESDETTLDLIGYDPDPLGERLSELTARMADAATPEEAMATAREVLALYHRISELTPVALQELADLFTGVGSCLAEVSWQLALGPAEQAVAMYRDLVRTGFRPPPDLSNSLSKLLVFLSEMSTCVPDDLIPTGDHHSARVGSSVGW